jgi:hypothetical protein
MKRIWIIIILIIILLIFPPIGILAIVSYIVYILYKKFRGNKKSVEKKIDNIRIYIQSFIGKNINKLNLREKIDIFEVEKFIYLIKINNKYMLFCNLYLENLNEKVDILDNNISGIYFIHNGKSLFIVVLEEFLSFKLTNQVLNTMLNRLLSKADWINSYFKVKGYELKFITPRFLVW